MVTLQPFLLLWSHGSFSLLHSKDPIHLWASQFGAEGFPLWGRQRLAGAGLERLLLTAQAVASHLFFCAGCLGAAMLSPATSLFGGPGGLRACWLAVTCHFFVSYECFAPLAGFKFGPFYK